MRQRAILITGCSSGIGRHCALAMRDRGWRVFATARTPDDIADLAARGLEATHLDYADTASVAAAVDFALAAAGGRLDALFNNGGYAQPGAIEDLSQAAIREQFDANFFGWHELVRLVVPVMRRQGSGRIVQNGSVLGFIAMPVRGAYTATKHAIEGYSDTLSMELAGSGIHVSVIEPGPIESRLAQNALKAARRHIDVESSVHRKTYQRRLAALERGGNIRGQLGPEAVMKALVHACESPRPKLRYRVTVPARVMAVARRVLPARTLVSLLGRIRA